MIKQGVNVNELPRFTNIKNKVLRDKNRGAIMTNIYESYRSNKDRLIALEGYMKDFSEEEQEAAKCFMVVHLKERGYTIVS